MISVHFDDIIYSLQNFGGASTYWAEMTARVVRDPRFRCTRRRPACLLRGVPSWSTADIFHSSHFRTQFPGAAKVVSTVHDMNYELGYVSSGWGARLNILERKLSYFTADALICISDSTRRELLEVYPQLAGRCPIHVVHHGLSEFGVVKSHHGPATQPGPYVLYVGARRGYKRFVDALEGFEASGVWKEGVKLLCTGAPFQADEVADIARRNLNGLVVSVAVTSRDGMASLYRNAHCLVYPSVHEGFGLPLLEAMSSGCPVVACNVSCIPEIVGAAAVLVRPHCADEVSAAIIALQNKDLRSRFIAQGQERVKGFSWDTSAESHMNIYLSTSAQAT